MTVIYVKVQLSVMVWRSRGTREGRINSNESVLLGLEKKKTYNSQGRLENPQPGWWFADPGPQWLQTAELAWMESHYLCFSLTPISAGKSQCLLTSVRENVCRLGQEELPIGKGYLPSFVWILTFIHTSSLDKIYFSYPETRKYEHSNACIWENQGVGPKRILEIMYQAWKMGLFRVPMSIDWQCL